MDEKQERGAQQIDDRSSTMEGSRLISPDRLLSAVANEHRRTILDSLISASDKTLEFDALVDCVADRHRDEDTEQVSDEHRHRVRIALHHTHLPKLEEVRIIEHETETGHVEFVGGELERELLTLLEPYETDE